MGKGNLRFQLDNPEDRERLSKLKDRKTGRTMLDRAQEAMVTHRPLIKESVDVSPGAEKGRAHFNARGQWFKGEYFHSTWELECWMVLLDLQRRGAIDSLSRQEKYVFDHNDVRITSYKADFIFRKNGTFHVVDAKQEHTAKAPRWKLVKRCMKAWYDIEVVVWYKGETDVEKAVHEL